MKTLLTIIIIALIGLGAYLFLGRGGVSPSPSPSPSPSLSVSGSPAPTPPATPSPTPAKTPVSQGRTFTVTILAGGTLSTKSLTIKKGDTVKFVNNDGQAHHIVTGVHPIHDICPSFDSNPGIPSNGTYSHTLTEVKTCPFHDHLDPFNADLKGQIIVTL